jgi:hypothetical protein
MKDSDSLSQIFQSFSAMYVSSILDVIEIRQEDKCITLPAQMVGTLIDSLRLAQRGEI